MRTRVSVAPRARGISTSSRPTVPGRSTFSARCRPTPQPGIPDVLLSLGSTYRPWTMRHGTRKEYGLRVVADHVHRARIVGRVAGRSCWD